MANEDILNDILEEIKTLQYRVGGAEFIIKSLAQRMSPEELRLVELEIKNAIANYGPDSSVAKLMDNSLRLLGK